MAGLFPDVVADVSRPEVAEDWASRIVRLWRPGFAWVVATGRELLAARAALGNGEWGRLFVDHPQSVRGAVPFTVRTAERLMAIARHPVTGDSARVSDLPAAWGTLAELAKLPPERVEQGIADGWVHPRMERRDVGGMPPVVLRECTSGEVVADKVRSLVVEQLERLPEAELRHVAWVLDGLAHDVRRRLGGQQQGE